MSNIRSKIIVIAVLYISPKKHINDISQFILKKLLDFTPEGSALVNEKLHELPMVLAGDFNIEFASNESFPLIQFLKDKLQLEINNNPKEFTTKGGTTIDAVFTRYLKVDTRCYISYFSYHRPLLSAIKDTDYVIYSENRLINSQECNNQPSQKSAPNSILHSNFEENEIDETNNNLNDQIIGTFNSLTNNSRNI